MRGVSGSSRAASYGLDTQYFSSAEREICVLVQIETAEGLRNLEAIAAVDGVDGVFIGPADLAASLGHLGDTQPPEVQAAVNDAFQRLKQLDKPAGYRTTNEAEAKRRVSNGVEFIAVGTDTSIIARGATALLERVACDEIGCLWQQNSRSVGFLEYTASFGRKPEFKVVAIRKKIAAPRTCRHLPSIRFRPSIGRPATADIEPRARPHPSRP